MVFEVFNSFNFKEVESLNVIGLIKHNSAMFSEVFEERKVNNIYLDSADFENCRAHLAGEPERFKIRIRWYGETFGVVRKPVLEFKIKKN